MKILYFAFSLLAVSTFVFAGGGIRPYDNSKPPKLSLPMAYERALVALGSETNALHCINARVSTDFTLDGGWEFTFCSTNKPPKSKFVTIDFDGEIHIKNFSGTFG